MTTDPNEWLMSTGYRSASFATVGSTAVGHIMRTPDMQQQRDFTTGELKVWGDGSPRMQLRVILMTEERDPDDPEDAGERALYVKGNMQRAVATAVRQAGAPGLEVGGKLLVKYTGDAPPTQRGINPAKLFEARYRRPDPAAVPVPEPPPDAPPAAAAPAADEVPF